jgi:DNA-binding transcriptional MerR regulator
MTMMDENIQIGELAEKAGVSVRTIRYYIEEGLLPAPAQQGRYAIFDEGYINRIRFIRRLKETYLPLKEIRELVNRLSDDEVKAMLSGESPTPAEARPLQVRESASEYIASLLQSRPQAPQPSRRMPPPQAVKPAPLPETGEAEKKSPDVLFQMSPPSVHEDEANLAFSAAGKASLSAPVPPTPNTWRRVEIAPGIELHLREPVDEKTERLIRRLLKEAGIYFA